MPLEDKFQIRYMFKDNPQTYFTYFYGRLGEAEAKLQYANRFFKRNVAKHFLGPANEYVKPED